MLPIADWSNDFRELQSFVQMWHGIRGTDSSNSPESAAEGLPNVLAMFYELCGAHVNKVVCFHRFEPARNINLAEVPVVFCWECQGVYVWAMEDAGENPRVLGRFNEVNATWRPAGERLCRFLLQLCILDAVINAPYGASASTCDDGTLKRMLPYWSELDLAPWPFPEYPTRFYRRGDAYAVTIPNFDGFTFKCGATRGESLRFVVPFVDKSWEWVNLSRGPEKGTTKEPGFRRKVRSGVVRNPSL